MANLKLSEQVDEIGKTVLSEAKSRQLTPNESQSLDKAPDSQAHEIKEKLPEFMSDLDVSGMTPSQIQALTEKGKQLYRKFQKDQENLAQEKRSLTEVKQLKEDIEADPDLKTAIERFYYAKKIGVDLTQPLTKKESDLAKKKFDQWLDQETDPTTKESLRMFRDAIHEEVGISDVKKQLTDIQQTIKMLMSNNIVSRQEQLSDEIGSLDEPLKDLVEKYQSQIMKFGTQYPQLKLKKLIQLVAQEDEYDQAVLLENKNKLKKEVDSKKGLQTMPSGMSLANEIETPASIKATSKMFGNRWDISKALDKIFPEIKRNMPSSL